MIEIDYSATVRGLLGRPDPVSPEAPPPIPFEVLPPSPVNETLADFCSELIDQMAASLGVPADVYRGARPADGFGPPIVRTALSALARTQLLRDFVQGLSASRETVSADVVTGDEHTVIGGES